MNIDIEQTPVRNPVVALPTVNCIDQEVPIRWQETQLYEEAQDGYINRSDTNETGQNNTGHSDSSLYP